VDFSLVGLWSWGGIESCGIQISKFQSVSSSFKPLRKEKASISLKTIQKNKWHLESCQQHIKRFQAVSDSLNNLYKLSTSKFCCV